VRKLKSKRQIFNSKKIHSKKKLENEKIIISISEVLILSIIEAKKMQMQNLM
jgi:hypothetical protein